MANYSYNPVCDYMNRSAGYDSCLPTEREETYTEFTDTKVGFVLQMLYLTLTAIMSLLSVIGSILIIYFYRKMQLRNQSRQLLVYLSFCDLMIALGNLIGIVWLFATGKHFTAHARETDSVCEVQAAISSGFSIASFFWTTFIAANVFLAVVYNSQAIAVKYSWLLHCLSWGVSITVVAVTLGLQRFGYDPCLDLVWWCWIEPHRHDSWSDVFLWKLLSGKLWEMLSYVLVCVFYAIVKIKLARHRKRIEASLVRSGTRSMADSRQACESTAYINAQKKLTYIPLVFIIGRVWGTLRFLLDIGPRTEMVGNYIAPLQGVGDSSQGFFNFLVIVRTTSQLREKFRCRRRRIRREQQMGDSRVQHNDGDLSDENNTSDSEVDLT